MEMVQCPRCKGVKTEDICPTCGNRGEVTKSRAALIAVYETRAKEELERQAKQDAADAEEIAKARTVYHGPLEGLIGNKNHPLFPGINVVEVKPGDDIEIHL